LTSATTAVDVDGDTVVVEFPKDQRMTMTLAQDPDTVQLLRRAIATVLGVKPPVRYQLGRGAVKPVEMPEPVAPTLPVDDAVQSTDEPESPSGEDADEAPLLEKTLMDEFGAEVIVERRHDEKK
jgi:hypothetical protein